MASKHESAKKNFVFLTRSPIFDQKRRLWGYELRTGGGRDEAAQVFSDKENTAADIASSAYIGFQQIMERGKKIVISFNEKGILDDAPYALPPEHTVVKVDEGLCKKSEIREALKRLRADGYQIAIDLSGPAPTAEATALPPHLLCLKGLDKSFKALPGLEKKPQPQFLAQGIKSLEQFESARKLGISLFQGTFFKEPEIIPDRKLSSHQITRMNLFKLIEQEDPDFNELSEAIKTDVSITFRFLAYLNTAAFGFTQKVQSIRQAITLLGWKKVKNWLRAVLLTDMAKSDEDIPELLHLSVQRGRFLELVANEYDYWGFDPGSLFLLGIFSLLDAMLGMPMKDVVEYLPLDRKLKSALCREPNNEYLPLFELVECLEDSDFERLDGVLMRLSLDPDRIKATFASAMQSANEFFMVKL